MFTLLPVDAKHAGTQTTGVKRNGLANSIKTPKKSATFQGGGGLGHRVLLELSQENRRVESYHKEAIFPSTPAHTPLHPPLSIALALSDMVMLIVDTGEGGSLHQHASEHHRAGAVIRIVH